MTSDPPSIEIGYKLSSEEFGPRQLVRQARRAEEVGFRFGLISDHFHPWTTWRRADPRRQRWPPAWATAWS